MDVRLVIDNEHVGAFGDATFERRNPASGDLVTRASAASVDDGNRAAASAKTAFASWSRTGPTERRKILLAAADRLEAKVEAIGAAMAGGDDHRSRHTGHDDL